MAFDLGFGLDAMDPQSYAGTWSGAPLTDTSWTSMASPSVPASGAGGFWSSLGDTAKALWGGAPASGGGGGTGFMGLLNNLGGVARAAMPLAQLGGGIASFIAQRDAMEQMKRQGQMQERAMDTAIQSAEASRPMAQSAAEVGGDLRSVAERVQPFSERAMEIAPEIRASAENVRTGIVTPVQQHAAARLARAQSGVVPPAIEEQLLALEAGEVQQIRDYLARAGMGDSSAIVMMENEARARTQRRRAEWLMQEERDALAAFDQARVGEATAASILGGESSALGAGANILGTEANILRGAADAYGVGGNILTGGGRVAGGASQALQQEQQNLEQLIAAAQQALARMSGAQA